MLIIRKKRDGMMNMDIFLSLLKAFIAGGAICLIGQVLMDTTKLTPGRILVAFVVLGVALTAVGVYEPFAEWAGAGATVPLTGFGYSLARGVARAVAEKGALGILTGGLTATAGGIAAAAVFSLLAAVLCRPSDKRKR